MVIGLLRPITMLDGFSWRPWRNRQTHQVQVLARSLSWGFKSLRPHKCSLTLEPQLQREPHAVRDSLKLLQRVL